MQVANAVRLFALKGLWTVTRLPVFGRPLVRALGSTDPNIRNIAGILIVRAGQRSVPLLTQALASGENPEMVLRVLGDVAGPELKSSILKFIQDPDVHVADAARDAIKNIDARIRYSAQPLSSRP